MKTAGTLEMPRGYNSEEIAEIRVGLKKLRAMNEPILLAAKMRQLAAEGRIRPASRRTALPVKHPPTFPGKALSEYLKDVREGLQVLDPAALETGGSK